VVGVRKAINDKDSFTRMKQERDAERPQKLAHQRAEQAAAAKSRAKIKDVSRQLCPPIAVPIAAR
jgi:hypothetical protein